MKYLFILCMLSLLTTNRASAKSRFEALPESKVGSCSCTVRDKKGTLFFASGALGLNEKTGKMQADAADIKVDGKIRRLVWEKREQGKDSDVWYFTASQLKLKVDQTHIKSCGEECMQFDGALSLELKGKKDSLPSLHGECGC